jgi:molybdate transport system substrate-binding protein
MAWCAKGRVFDSAIYHAILRFMKTLLTGFALLFVACHPAFAGDVTVSAAASLGNAFREIARNYEARYPGVQVALNFGASGALLQQIAKGAPVDVLATADQETMNLADKQGLLKAGERHNFVSNALVVVVPRSSAHPIKDLGDLALPAVKRVAIGLPASVPAGRYAKMALENAKLWRMVEPKAINTQNVRQSLDYVARGEVDAGFVYATDAALMPDKVRSAYTVVLDSPILYPASTLARAPNVREAKRFIDYLLSPAGQAVLAKFGFGKP